MHANAIPYAGANAERVRLAEMTYIEAAVDATYYVNQAIAEHKVLFVNAADEAAYYASRLLLYTTQIAADSAEAAYAAGGNANHTKYAPFVNAAAAITYLAAHQAAHDGHVAFFTSSDFFIDVGVSPANALTATATNTWNPLGDWPRTSRCSRHARSTSCSPSSRASSSSTSPAASATSSRTSSSTCLQRPAHATSPAC